MLLTTVVCDLGGGEFARGDELEVGGFGGGEEVGDVDYEGGEGEDVGVKRVGWAGCFVGC